jgi:hypothetical protein
MGTRRVMPFNDLSDVDVPAAVTKLAVATFVGSEIDVATPTALPGGGTLDALAIVEQRVTPAMIEALAKDRRRFIPAYYYIV